jgi:hypothetical protein
MPTGMPDPGEPAYPQDGRRRPAPTWLESGATVCSVLRGPLRTPAVAARFAQAGWSSRSSSWHGYEVETDWCQIGLDPLGTSDTLLGGAVVPDRLDSLARLLTESGLSFTLELYDAEGELLREVHGPPVSGICPSEGGTGPVSSIP